MDRFLCFVLALHIIFCNLFPANLTSSKANSWSIHQDLFYFWSRNMHIASNARTLLYDFMYYIFTTSWLRPWEKLNCKLDKGLPVRSANKNGSEYMNLIKCTWWSICSWTKQDIRIHSLRSCGPDYQPGPKFFSFSLNYQQGTVQLVKTKSVIFKHCFNRQICWKIDLWTNWWVGSIWVHIITLFFLSIPKVWSKVLELLRYQW